MVLFIDYLQDTILSIVYIQLAFCNSDTPWLQAVLTCKIYVVDDCCQV